MPARLSRSTLRIRSPVADSTTDRSRCCAFSFALGDAAEVGRSAIEHDHGRSRCVPATPPPRVRDEIRSREGGGITRSPQSMPTHTLYLCMHGVVLVNEFLVYRKNYIHAFTTGPALTFERETNSEGTPDELVRTVRRTLPDFVRLSPSNARLSY